MIMRASELSLINPDQSKKLWINLGRRKWRLREPLDNELEIESPQYLRRCMELLLERRMIGPNDLSAQLGLPPADIEQLMGLKRGTLDNNPMPIEVYGEEKAQSVVSDGEPDVIPFRIAQ
jgi:hypothetical protein